MTPHREMIFEEVDVEDFAKWKVVFDKYQPQRRKYGFVGERVFRDVENPNHVAMIFDIESRELASEWQDSEELLAVRQAAGVIGNPVYGYKS